MYMHRFISYSIILFALILSASACKNRKHIGEKQIVEKPAEINLSATEILQGTLTDMLKEDSIEGMSGIKNALVIKDIYKSQDYLPIWTSDGKWTAQSDSLFLLVKNCRYYGLFPSDYFQPQLTSLRQTLSDTSAGKNMLDASLWAEADLYFTAGFVQIIKDLKNGRILQDTTALKKDSALNGNFFLEQLSSFKNDGVDTFASRFEPRHAGYKAIKEAMKSFVTTADFRSYTYVNFKDSLNLRKMVGKRLDEEDSIHIANDDSLAVAAGVKQYQKINKIKPDGKISSTLVSKLNQTDLNKFIKIAINLDRYKLLPTSLPPQYVWVNIPAYYLLVMENDTIKLTSKVVVGKPETRTPILSSSITDMITYPQWTIPESIIKKDILPGLKRDPSYTIKKGFSLIDNKGNVIDPYSVDWSKYETGIPYKVVQGSGDDNALGVLKFNFSNKYSVYLHDTNQRYLFSKKERALSHGCVRVQNWDSLAHYILRNDSLKSKNAIPIDSMNVWLALKQKHIIPVRKRIPLFIRYFTCETRNDELIFFEDVYGDDRRIKDRFFKNKN